MAREYWRIRSTWWTGETGRVLRKHPAVVREVGIYLFSAPTANEYGLYYLPVLAIANDTGRQPRQIDEAMTILHELAFAYYDPINQFVWVREMCAQQMCPLPLQLSDWKVRAANRWYRTCPANLFLGPWFDHYGELLRISGARRDWRPGQQPTLFASQDSPQQGTSTLDQVPGTTTGLTDRRYTTERGKRFERFWMAWPKSRRIGKHEARSQWDRLDPDDELTEAILGAVERQKQTKQWLRESGRFIVHPSRYLKYRRWEDEIVVVEDLSDSTIASASAVAEFLKQKPEKDHE